MSRFYSNKDMELMTSKKMRGRLNYFHRLEYSFIFLNQDGVSHTWGIPNFSLALSDLNENGGDAINPYNQIPNYFEYRMYGQLPYYIGSDFHKKRLPQCFNCNYHSFVLSLLVYAKYIAKIYYLIGLGVSSDYFIYNMPEIREWTEHSKRLFYLIFGHYSDKTIGGSI